MLSEERVCVLCGEVTLPRVPLPEGRGGSRVTRRRVGCPPAICRPPACSLHTCTMCTMCTPLPSARLRCTGLIYANAYLQSVQSYAHFLWTSLMFKSMHHVPWSHICTVHLSCIQKYAHLTCTSLFAKVCIHVPCSPTLKPVILQWEKEHKFQQRKAHQI